jgi:hypothetical protein
LNAWTWFMTYSLKKVTGWPRTERCAWPWWVMTWRQLLWVVVLWKMSCLKQHRTFGYIWFVRGNHQENGKQEPNALIEFMQTTL